MFKNDFRFAPYFRGNRNDNQNRGQRLNSRFDIDFSQNPRSSQMRSRPHLKKSNTIAVDIFDDNCSHVTEETLKDYFQQNFGSVSKIWFNCDKNKAFIGFHNYLTVDLIVNNGNHMSVCGLKAYVRPYFERETPFKGGQNIVKVILDLVKIETIDKNNLLYQLSKTIDFDEQMDLFLSTITLSEMDVLKRNEFKEKLEEILNTNHFYCRLNIFGSQVNGLAFCDSDIDISVQFMDNVISTTGEETEETLDFERSMNVLKRMQLLFKKCFNLFIANPIPSLRCPIIHIDFNKKPGLSPALVCDLSLSNRLAGHNSRLIRLFCNLSPRFQRLCLCLRFWAKTNGFISGFNAFSSYAFTHLVLFFCQSLHILPSLDFMRESSPSMAPIIINGWDISFPEDFTYDENHENCDSIQELLKQFFEFYAKFDFTTQMISTRTGVVLHKRYFQPIPTGDIPVPQGIKLTPLICIEDPFELSHNLCSNINYKTFDKFCDYLSHISANFETLFLRKTNEESINYDLSFMCRECDPIPTGYVFSEYFVGFANLELILDPDLGESNHQLMQIIANRLTDLTVLWLSDVYAVECPLLSKWDLMSNQFSPFAEFYIKLQALDIDVWDYNKRLEFRQQLSEDMSQEMSFIERERWITEKIRSQNDCPPTSPVPQELHFMLVMNFRSCFPTIELTQIYINPFQSSQYLMTFLRRMIASAANDCQLLTVAKEFIIP